MTNKKEGTWRRLLQLVTFRRASPRGKDGPGRASRPLRSSPGPLTTDSIPSSSKTTPVSSSIQTGGKVEVIVFDGQDEIWHGITKTPLEIGRQQEGDAGPLDLHDLVTVQRLVIAPVSARSIPRQAIRVDGSEDGCVAVTNIHPRLSFYVGLQAEPLAPGETFTSEDEMVVAFPENRTIRITNVTPDSIVSNVGRLSGQHHHRPPELEAGTELGQYVIQQTLGRGGMGVVYLALHPRMKRMVAVKVPPLFHENERMLERFQQEVEVSGRLKHVHILHAYDAGFDGGQPYLVTERIQGRTVAEVVRSRGRLDVEQTIQYSIQAASGLGYAHSKNIIHRDVKPANLMIDDEDGLLRVIDFGLAAESEGLLNYPNDMLDRELPESIRSMDLRADFLEAGLATMMVMPRSLSSTHNSQLVGTPAYMSPEQTCAVDVDRRSDVYSLGCTIFFMLTARHVFESEGTRTAGEVLMRHRREPPTRISELRDDCSEMLEETLLRMLAKRAEERFSSMEEVIGALKEEQAKLGFGNRVFISYRRDDSFDATHRLYENLEVAFGKNSLMMDIDAIPAGEDFRKFIVESVRRASAVLVVIGDHWSAIQDESGNRRLDNVDDYVRLEIEIAQKYGKPIIPVLVGRAEMPTAVLLPDTLQFMAYRNAAEVRSGKGYSHDVNRLIARLHGILG